MDSETLDSEIDQLAAQGTVYFTSDDIADRLDVDDTTGKKGHISRLLSKLDRVEKWGRSKNITWKITDGGEA